jgi:hypothetical protein
MVFAFFAQTPLLAQNRPAPRVNNAVVRLASEFKLDIFSDEPSGRVQGSYFEFHEMDGYGVITPHKDSSFKFRFHNYDFDPSLGEDDGLSEEAFLSLRSRILQHKSGKKYGGPQVLGLTRASRPLGKPKLGLRVIKVVGKTSEDLIRYKSGPGNVDQAKAYISLIEDAANDGLIAMDAHSGNLFFESNTVRPVDVWFASPKELANRLQPGAYFRANHEGTLFDNTIRTIQRAKEILGHARSVHTDHCSHVIRQIADLYQTR